MNQLLLEGLHDELRVFCTTYHLKHLCALEMLFEDNLTPLQRDYLENFNARWDEALESE